MKPMPFSQSCENNKWPILDILQRVFTEPALILEIGTGTGQHAELFAAQMPHLTWQPTDRPGDHELCRQRLNEAALPNVEEPLPMDVLDPAWPISRADGAFSANTLHIMGWDGVEALFRGLGSVLSRGGYFCVYGPFTEGGRFTSDSNARFHEHLRSQDPAMGIRDVDALKTLGEGTGLALIEQYPMPANNQLLVWQRR